MTHLLKNTSIFVPLENDCLCQMAGKPLIYLKPPTAPIAGFQANPPPVLPNPLKKRTFKVLEEEERSTKRLKLTEGNVSRPPSFDRLAPDVGDKRRYVRHC